MTADAIQWPTSGEEQLVPIRRRQRAGERWSWIVSAYAGIDIRRRLPVPLVGSTGVDGEPPSELQRRLNAATRNLRLPLDDHEHRGLPVEPSLLWAAATQLRSQRRSYVRADGRIAYGQERSEYSYRYGTRAAEFTTAERESLAKPAPLARLRLLELERVRRMWDLARHDAVLAVMLAVQGATPEEAQALRIPASRANEGVLAILREWRETVVAGLADLDAAPCWEALRAEIADADRRSRRWGRNRGNRC